LKTSILTPNFEDFNSNASFSKVVSSDSLVKAFIFNCFLKELTYRTLWNDLIVEKSAAYWFN